MLKDKVVQDENGIQYYVLEELVHNNKKYIMALECDLDNDLVNKDDYVILEVVVNNDDLVLKNIDNDELIKVLVGLFFNKISNS